MNKRRPCWRCPWPRLPHTHWMWLRRAPAVVIGVRPGRGRAGREGGCQHGTERNDDLLHGRPHDFAGGCALAAAFALAGGFKPGAGWVGAANAIFIADAAFWDAN